MNSENTHVTGYFWPTFSPKYDQLEFRVKFQKCIKFFKISEIVHFPLEDNRNVGSLWKNSLEASGPEKIILLVHIRIFSRKDLQQTKFKQTH